MNIQTYIINDVEIQPLDAPIQNLKDLFNELTYSHLAIAEKGEFIGCISENDVRCFDGKKSIKDYRHAVETFFVRENDNWLDILEAFARQNTNFMPVLEAGTNKYIGYLELSDIISIFNETPFLSEVGSVLVIEKGFKDYSFSEITQIIESNEGKILGLFISQLSQDLVQITIKIGLSSINEIIQSFRRYSYKVVSSHQEDTFLKNLKERSDYLNKYLNI
ncbi:CBS domain-containing protein [Mesonia maritima]|uniref:Transcriptional regulator n=1 Tax=Mesonia maritima TaxID=1793873 RepID=A0ABU1K3M5_9FLAO|nr:CBS domain-containing protein [Mesonia maritima]MDR6300204.1 putative transcriptional regulator [Mesonia maritima]